MTEINFDRLTEIKEIQAILSLYFDAINYIEDFNWCVSTKKCWYDKEFSIYNKIGVFLIEIEPLNKNVDDFIWVIVGDLPSVYLDKSITTGHEAMEKYCELMQEWVDNVKSGKSTDECYPVLADPTNENTELLSSRIAFIRRELLMKDDR
jgi:hypothetical protein